MHRALLLLVEAHARLGVVAPSLTSRVLEALVTGLTEVALQCFQQVPKFGTGGMLTVSRKALLQPIPVATDHGPIHKC
jgi:exocyst complex component 2